MHTFGPETREQVIERLRERQARGEKLNKETIDKAAAAFGITDKSMWRWIKHGPPKKRGRKPKVEVTPDVEALIIEHGGRVTAITADLNDQGAEVTRHSVRRALARAPRAEMLMDAAREGHNGVRSHLLRVGTDPCARNERWEADCSELPFQVRLPNHVHPGKAWITAIIDVGCRAIVGHAISVGSTTAASVLTALHAALRVDEELGPFGGRPGLIVYDGGKQYLADAVTGCELALGIAGHACRPYSPEQKAHIERFFGTLKNSKLAELDFHKNGPRDLKGNLIATGSDEPPSLAALKLAVDEAIYRYNHEHRHKALGGRTPLQAWEDFGPDLELIDERELAFACLERHQRKVGPLGISFKDVRYQHSKLREVEGKTVEIGAMPWDGRSIEVFFEGQWRCQAKPKGDLSPEEKQDIWATQRADKAKVAAAKRRSKRRKKARLSPAAPGQVNEDVTVMTREQAGDLMREVKGAKLAQVARELPDKAASTDSDVWDPEADL